MNQSSAQAAIAHLIRNCGKLKPSERLLIICDSSTKSIAEAFEQNARSISPQVKVVEVPLAERHGQEPPEDTARMMLGNDLIISLRSYSLAHSTARVEAAKQGARFLSMPDYSWEMLADPALMVDYEAQFNNVKFITDKFSAGSVLRVRGVAGTDIKLNIAGRIGNCCPGFVQLPGQLGSPPDIEANISPLETASEGIAVIDGSITCPELGLLTDQVELQVKHGLISKISSKNKQYQSFLESIFGESGSKRRVLAECGVGLNPKAALTGKMLTDEGAFGCLHFGFGANHTVGGANKVDFHLDFVFRQGTIEVDGQEILHDGNLIL